MKKILAGVLLLVSNCFIVKADDGVSISSNNNQLVQGQDCTAVTTLQKLALQYEVKEESLTAFLQELAAQLEKGKAIEDLSVIDKKEMEAENNSTIMTIILAAGGITVLSILVTWLLVKPTPEQGRIHAPAQIPGHRLDPDQRQDPAQEKPAQEQEPELSYIFEPDTVFSVTGGPLEFRGHMIRHPGTELHFNPAQGGMRIEE